MADMSRADFLKKLGTASVAITVATSLKGLAGTTAMASVIGGDVTGTTHIYPTGDPVQDTGNLQNAIDAASPGGVIEMAAGTWVFGAPLTNDFYVRLMRNGVPVQGTTYSDMKYSEQPQLVWNLVGSDGVFRPDLVRQGINIDKPVIIRGDPNGGTKCTTVEPVNWELFIQSGIYWGIDLTPIGVTWALHSELVTLENLHFDRFSGWITPWHPFIARNVKFTRMGFAPLYGIIDGPTVYPNFYENDYSNGTPSLVENCTFGTPEHPTQMATAYWGVSEMIIRGCDAYIAGNNFHAAIQVFTDYFPQDLVNNVMIENCSIETESWMGVECGALGGKAQNLVIRNSTINADSAGNPSGHTLQSYGIFVLGLGGPVENVAVVENKIGNCMFSAVDVTGVNFFDPFVDGTVTGVTAKDNHVTGGPYFDSGIGYWGSVFDSAMIKNNYRMSALPGWAEGPGCSMLFYGTVGNVVHESGGFPHGTDAKDQVLDLGQNRVVGHPQKGNRNPGIGRQRRVVLEQALISSKAEKMEMLKEKHRKH